MKTPVLRVAIAGCGRIAEERHVPALRDLAGRVSIEAVCDPVAERRERFGRLLSLGPERLHPDLRELLARSDVDVVDVAAPQPAHEELVLAACAARKHVICEEPLATTLAEADRALAAAEAAGVSLGVVHDRRYEPPIRKALWLLHDGAIGVPFSIRAEALEAVPVAGEAEPAWRQERRAAGGGCLLDAGYHYLYLAREMMLSDVRRVSAIIGTFSRPLDVEDHAFVLLHHKNGGVTSLQVSRAVRGPAASVFEIYGSSGILAIGKNGTPLSLYRESTQTWEHPEVEPANSFTTAFAEFLYAVESGAPPPVCGDEARRNLRVLLAAYESARAGSAVAVS